MFYTQTQVVVDDNTTVEARPTDKGLLLEGWAHRHKVGLVFTDEASLDRVMSALADVRLVLAEDAG